MLRSLLRNTIEQCVSTCYITSETAGVYRIVWRWHLFLPSHLQANPRAPKGLLLEGNTPSALARRCWWHESLHLVVNPPRKWVPNIIFYKYWLGMWSGLEIQINRLAIGSNIKRKIGSFHKHPSTGNRLYLSCCVLRPPIESLCSKRRLLMNTAFPAGFKTHLEHIWCVFCVLLTVNRN